MGGASQGEQYLVRQQDSCTVAGLDTEPYMHLGRPECIKCTYDVSNYMYRLSTVYTALHPTLDCYVQLIRVVHAVSCRVLMSAAARHLNLATLRPLRHHSHQAVVRTAYLLPIIHTPGQATNWFREPNLTTSEGGTSLKCVCKPPGAVLCPWSFCSQPVSYPRQRCSSMSTRMCPNAFLKNCQRIL